MSEEKIHHPDQEEELDQTYGWKFHKWLILIAAGLTAIFYISIYSLSQI
jgi:hypothetical protein